MQQTSRCPPEPLAPAMIARLADLASADPVGRIRRITLEGAVYWVKRPERRSLRWRLQKGDPQRRFARERAAMHGMHALGVPVPPIVAEGPDFLVLPDCGPTLAQILRDGSADDAQQAMVAAGAALAALHARGLAHGRPALRDLCWDGRTLRFLDFERSSPPPVSKRAQAHDLLVFLHSAVAQSLRPGDAGMPPAQQAAVDAAAASYRAADTRQVWQAAIGICAWLRRVEPLTRPLQRREARRGPEKSYREFQAVPHVLAMFPATPRGGRGGGTICAG